MTFCIAKAWMIPMVADELWMMAVTPSPAKNPIRGCSNEVRRLMKGS